MNNSAMFSSRALTCLLGASLLLPLACKDEAPCDEGQVSVGTSCFVEEPDGAGGADTQTPPGDGGAIGASSGNPDATFRTACQTDADCGGDAPVCATDPLFYCTQLECQEGEANAGACPTDWQCIKLDAETPSACVDLNGF